MELTDVFKFGKYKDQTLEQVLKNPRGISWVQWYVDQPSQNPQYAEKDKAQKNRIREHLVNAGAVKPRDPITSKSREVLNAVEIHRLLANLDTKMDIILGLIRPPNEKQEEKEEESWQEEES